MENTLFTSWETVLRIFLTTIAAYIALIVILRISGNRTLSKMNSFDFVVTIAIGSTLSAGILQKSVSLLDVMVALVGLVGLQYLITSAAVRWEKFDRVLKSEPTLLVLNGRFSEGAMKKVRITHEEILGSIRQNGFTKIEQVGAVVLETNGKLSVIEPAKVTSLPIL